MTRQTKYLICILLIQILGSCANDGPFVDNFCGNKIIKEIASPDKDYSAIMFVRDCGATTGYSTQVSIVEYGDKLENTIGNILVMSDKPSGAIFENGGAMVEIAWNANNELNISYDKACEVFKNKSHLDGIKINYTPLDTLTR